MKKQDSHVSIFKDSTRISSSLYIVKAFEGRDSFEYEFGNLKHARELFDNESSAHLLEYVNGKYHLMEVK